MTEPFQWNKQLMRRARYEFGCMECGVKNEIYIKKSRHPEGCSFGIKMSAEDKNNILSEWATRLQSIIKIESRIARKPTKRCLQCSKNATGTIWVAYHDDSTLLVIMSQYASCGECSIEVPPEWVQGRKWGFVDGLVTDKPWKLMDCLEDYGVI